MIKGNLESVFKDRKLRRSHPRLLIYQELSHTRALLSPQELYQVLLKKEKKVGLTSIYRSLELFESLGIYFQLKVRMFEIKIIPDALPSDQGRGEPLRKVFPAIKYADAFRTEKPLVRIGCKKIDMIFPYIHREKTKALDRVNTKKNVLLSAQIADFLKVYSESVRKLN